MQRQAKAKAAPKQQPCKLAAAAVPAKQRRREQRQERQLTPYEAFEANLVSF